MQKRSKPCAIPPRSSNNTPRWTPAASDPTDIRWYDYDTVDLAFIEYAVGPESVTTTPEPASVALLLTGIVGLAGVARRKAR